MNAPKTPPVGRRELVTRSGRPRHGGFSEATASVGEAPLRVTVKHPGVARWGSGVRPGPHPETHIREAWKEAA